MTYTYSCNQCIPGKIIPSFHFHLLTDILPPGKHNELCQVILDLRCMFGASGAWRNWLHQPRYRNYTLQDLDQLKKVVRKKIDSIWAGVYGCCKLRVV